MKRRRRPIQAVPLHREPSAPTQLVGGLLLVAAALGVLRIALAAGRW